MLGRAETVGVFQLESSGMRDVLRRLKADCFEDIIAVVALTDPARWTIWMLHQPQTR